MGSFGKMAGFAIDPAGAVTGIRPGAFGMSDPAAEMRGEDKDEKRAPTTDELATARAKTKDRQIRAQALHPISASRGLLK